jgi:hypothetical protein
MVEQRTGLLCALTMCRWRPATPRQGPLHAETLGARVFVAAKGQDCAISFRQNSLVFYRQRGNTARESSEYFLHIPISAHQLLLFPIPKNMRLHFIFAHESDKSMNEPSPQRLR